MIDIDYTFQHHYKFYYKNYEWCHREVSRPSKREQKLLVSFTNKTTKYVICHQHLHLNHNPCNNHDK